MIIEQGTPAEAIIIRIPLVFSKVDYAAKEWSATSEALLREIARVYRETMLREIDEAGWGGTELAGVEAASQTHASPLP